MTDPELAKKIYETMQQSMKQHEELISIIDDQRHRYRETLEIILHEAETDGPEEAIAYTREKLAEYKAIERNLTARWLTAVMGWHTEKA